MSGKIVRQLCAAIKAGSVALAVIWVTPAAAQNQSQPGMGGPVPAPPHRQVAPRRAGPASRPQLQVGNLIGRVMPTRLLGSQQNGMQNQRNQAAAQSVAAPTVDPLVTQASHTVAAGTPAAEPELMQGNGVAPASLTTCDAVGCDSIGMPSAGMAGNGVIGALPFWGSIDYLLWWQEDSDLPTFATSSTAGTSRDEAGVLGFDTTTILFGDEQLDDDALDGVRFTLGMWLGPGQQTGLFGRWFSLDGYEENFVSVANGDDILGRPFFNVLTNEEDALLLGFPNEIEGDMSLSLNSETESFQLLIRQMFRTGCNYRIDLVYGYRNMTHDENLRIDNSLEFVDPTAGTFGTVIDQFDLFDIENEFHGGEFGFMGHSSDGNWTMDFIATVALGTMDQTARMAGSTTTTAANGAVFVADGGLLTQTSNIGTFEDDPFTVIPEIAFKLGYYITPRFDVSVGYTFLYATNLLRLEGAIDTGVNLNQQTGVNVGPARPAPTFTDDSFWVQGLSFGANLRY